MQGAGADGVAVACAQSSILGEGPVWDHRIGRLHWVDIRAQAILTLDPVTGVSIRRPMPEETGFVALTPDPNIVVAGFKSGLFKVALDTSKATRLVAVEADKPGNRINDGTVSADGAILFGTLDRSHEAASGTFWRYHKGTLSALGGAMVITNGPGMSRDGRTALTVDSIGRQMFTQSYADGSFGPASVFAELPAGQGVPDGVCYDAEGHIWVAHYGGSCLTRFKPDGTIDRTVALPTNQVTKCAFGGPDLKTLYITTAAYRRNLADEPLAGCLFKADLGIAGLPANIADV